jgi:hypothetical protein
MDNFGEGYQNYSPDPKARESLYNRQSVANKGKSSLLKQIDSKKKTTEGDKKLKLDKVNEEDEKEALERKNQSLFKKVGLKIEIEDEEQ